MDDLSIQGLSYVKYPVDKMPSKKLNFEEASAMRIARNLTQKRRSSDLKVSYFFNVGPPNDHHLWSIFQSGTVNVRYFNSKIWNEWQSKKRGPYCPPIYLLCTSETPGELECCIRIPHVPTLLDASLFLLQWRASLKNLILIQWHQIDRGSETSQSRPGSNVFWSNVKRSSDVVPKKKIHNKSLT